MEAAGRGGALSDTFRLHSVSATLQDARRRDVAVGDPAFLRTLEAQTDAELLRGNRAQVLLNGDEIFPAMLAAIRAAKKTITFANFIYEKGDISSEMAHALAERALAGVGVNVLVDAVGSKGMPSKDRELMEKAGCHVAT